MSGGPMSLLFSARWGLICPGNRPLFIMRRKPGHEPSEMQQIGSSGTPVVDALCSTQEPRGLRKSFFNTEQMYCQDVNETGNGCTTSSFPSLVGQHGVSYIKGLTLISILTAWSCKLEITWTSLGAAPDGRGNYRLQWTTYGSGRLHQNRQLL